MTTILTKTNSQEDLPPIKRSLNQHVRQRERQKIIQENEQILRRLMERKSSYNTDPWQRQESQRLKMVRNMCEFPYMLRTNSTHRSISHKHERPPAHTQTRDLGSGELFKIEIKHTNK